MPWAHRSGAAAFVTVAVLLAGCASEPAAPPSDGSSSSGPSEAATSSSGAPASDGMTTSEPRQALFALMERWAWINRTSGDGAGSSTHFGGHCAEASWSDEPARVRVQRFGERTAAPWPASGILVTATAHAGFGEMAMSGTTAPVVAAFHAEADAVPIPAAVTEHGNLTRLDADRSSLSIGGVPLAEGEERTLDFFYTIEHDDGRWTVHERLRFMNHGEATVTVASTEGLCD